jgi:hypothetical protein
MLQQPHDASGIALRPRCTDTNMSCHLNQPTPQVGNATPSKWPRKTEVEQCSKMTSIAWFKIYSVPEKREKQEFKALVKKT